MPQNGIGKLQIGVMDVIDLEARHLGLEGADNGFSGTFADMDEMVGQENPLFCRSRVTRRKVLSNPRNGESGLVHWHYRSPCSSRSISRSMYQALLSGFTPQDW